jgi:hypothetical protein
VLTARISSAFLSQQSIELADFDYVVGLAPPTDLVVPRRALSYLR